MELNSIDSSPTKDKCALQKTWSQRRKKRKLLEESALEESGNIIPKLESTDCMYENENVNKQQESSSCLSFYDPFHDQMLLAAADLLDRGNLSQARQAKNILPVVGHFKKCDDLMKLENNNTLNNLGAPNVALESEFAITDSELLNCCNDAEEVLHCEDVKTPQTMNKSKSIVEMILDDFCSSPLSPEGLLASPSTPAFCLKREKSVRTYIQRRHRRRAGRNIAIHFDSAEKSLQICQQHEQENDIISDDDECVSICSSSGLSVQVDVTHQQHISVNTIEIKNSQKICENLLNLSDYFARTTDEDSAEPSIITSSAKPIRTQKSELFLTALDVAESNADIVMQEQWKEELLTPNATQLIAEILTLRQKYPISFKRNSSSQAFADFPGFQNDSFVDSVLDNKVDYTEINANNCDTLCSNTDQEWGDDDDDFFIDCDFLKNLENVSFPRTIKIEEENCNLQESIIKTEAIKTDINLAANEVSEKSVQRDQNILQNLSKLNKENICIKQEFEVATKCSEKASQNLTRKDDNMQELPSFKTASMKAIGISAEATKRANCILENLPQLSTFADNEKPSTSKAAAAAAAKTNLWLPNKKTKEIPMQPEVRSEQKFEEEELANIQLSEWPLEDENQCSENTFKRDMNDSDDIHNEKKEEAEECEMQFVGFRTASKKGIQITKEARKKMQNIFNALPEIEPKKINEKHKNIENRMAENKVDDEKEEFMGFSTASRKTINISEEAKKKMQNIFHALPEIEPKKLNKNEVVEIKVNKDEEFMGFSTASKKIIQVSSQAKEKIANLFNNLSGIVLENKNANQTQNRDELDQKAILHEFDDIQLSEWPFDEMKISALNQERDNTNSKPKSSTPLCSKVLQKSFTSHHIESTTTTLRSYAENGVLKNSLSNIELPSALTTSKRTSVIGRRNLLSLSKRHKVQHTPTNTASPHFQTPLRDENAAKAAKEIEISSNVSRFPNGILLNTSTPRAMQNASKLHDIDADFKQIVWERNNESFSCSQTSKLNTSINATSPPVSLTPKERFDRLSVYGDPPSISPLSTLAINSNKKSRTLGLRRGRSLVSKK